MTPEAIKHLRATLNLTQAQLADTLGVSLNTIKSWEIGRLEPGAQRINQMTIMLQPGRVRAARLSDSLASAAELAEANAAADIAAGHPEAAEVAQRLAGHLRRLTGNHQAMGATDPMADPAQITRQPQT